MMNLRQIEGPGPEGEHEVDLVDEVPLKLHVGAGKPEAPCLGRHEVMNMRRVPQEEDEIPEVDYLCSWATHYVGNVDLGFVDYHLTRRHHIEGDVVPGGPE